MAAGSGCFLLVLSLSLSLSCSSSIPNTIYQPESQHCRYISARAHHPHTCVGSYVEILVLERNSCNGVTIGGRMTTTNYPLLLPSLSPSCGLIYHRNPFVRTLDPTTITPPMVSRSHPISWMRIFMECMSGHCPQTGRDNKRDATFLEVRKFSQVVPL